MQRSQTGLSFTPSRGFTMLELLISGVLLVVMMGVIFRFTMVGQELARVESKVAILQAQTMEKVENIVDDIRRSGNTQTVPANPTGAETSVAFKKVMSLAIDADLNVTPTYADNLLEYSIEIEPGETQNGVDDNANGLIDEYQLRRFSGDLASDGVTRISAIVATGIKGYDITSGLNVQGFQIRQAAPSNRLRVLMTLQKYDQKLRRLFEASYGSSVTSRMD